MYFKTPRDSKTGRKFQSVYQKMNEADAEAWALCQELGGKSYGPDRWSVAGGIERISFPTERVVDRKLWRSQDNGWYPIKNRKANKVILAKLDSLPKVPKKELNMCIGWDYHFGNIGFNSNNPKYFLFAVQEDWKIDIPEDCEEITTTEYRELVEKSESVNA